MKKIVSVSLILLVAFAACNKTKTFTKRLTGKWNITKYEYTHKSNNQTDETYSFDNKGAVELKDDQTGTCTIPVDKNGTMVTYAVTDWFNSADEVMIKLKDGVGNEMTEIYKATTNEKKSQVWEMTVSYTAGGGSSVSTYKITLAKQ